jgi:hypothetical protein
MAKKKPGENMTAINSPLIPLLKSLYKDRYKKSETPEGSPINIFKRALFLSSVFKEELGNYLKGEQIRASYEMKDNPIMFPIEISMSPDLSEESKASLQLAQRIANGDTSSINESDAHQVELKNLNQRLKNSPCINRSELLRAQDAFGLSLGHIIMNLGDLELAEIAFEACLFNPSLKDCQGLSIAHHAAVQENPAFFSRLEAWGLLNSENSLRGALLYTPEELFSASHESEDTENSILFKGRETRSFIPLTPRQQIQKGLPVMHKLNKIPPSFFWKIWNQSKIKGEEVQLFNFFDSRIQSLQDLSIAPQTSLVGLKEESSPSMGYGVAAVKDIPPFSLACEYITSYVPTIPDAKKSHVIPKEHEYRIGFPHSEYAMNSLNHMSLGAMTQDGFPNSFLEGVSERFFLVSQEEGIKAGEGVFWNYGGGHLIKLLNYRELNKSGRLSFLNNNPVNSWMEKLIDREHAIRQNPSVENRLKRKDFLEKIIYFYSTPSILLKCFLDGSIPLTKKTLKEMKSISKLIESVSGTYATKHFSCFLYLFEQVLKLKIDGKGSFKGLEDFLLPRIEEDSFQVITNFFQNSVPEFESYARGGIEREFALPCLQERYEHCKKGIAEFEEQESKNNSRDIS